MSKSVTGNKLTAKQQLFVEQYLICWNATEAARRAGYSPHTAQVIGAENLTKPVIREAVERKLREHTMSADEVLSRLAQLAKADLRDFVVTDEHGEPIGFDFSTHKPLHVIKKMSIQTESRVTDEGETKTTKKVAFELHDAHAALVKLGEYYKLFTHRVELDVTEELKRVAEQLGLTTEDIQSDPLLAEFFKQDVRVTGEPS